MDLTEIYNALALSKPKRRKINRVIKRAKRKDISYKRLRNIGKYLPGFMYCIYHHKDTPENPEDKKYSYNEVVGMLEDYQNFLNR